MGRGSRYELKFLIEEPRAVAVADYVSTYLHPSPNNGSGPIRGHPVMSLYLDSPDYFLFRQSYTGHKNRMKLRIRFYDSDWKKPAVLEIKRRVAEVVCKDRAVMTREGVRQVLTAGWPERPFAPNSAHLLKRQAQEPVGNDFWSFANTIRANGSIFVTYYREVYESNTDDELRVTLDRYVHGSRYEGDGRMTAPRRGWRPYLPPHMAPFPRDGVILELKFNNQAPQWMFELARIFNLRQISICKYSACVFAQQLQWQRKVLPEQEEELVLL